MTVWKGDDEVRSSAHLLFDEGAYKSMSTEDLAAVGSLVLTQLIKAGASMDGEINDHNTALA